MPIPVFEPPMRPSAGTSIGQDIKLRKAEFGDGYVQSSPAGLNHIRRVVSLRWEYLSLAEARQIEAFMVARGGCQPFQYALNGEAVARKWTCQDWRLTDGHPARFTATFREDFGL